MLQSWNVYIVCISWYRYLQRTSNGKSCLQQSLGVKTSFFAFDLDRCKRQRMGSWDVYLPGRTDARALRLSWECRRVALSLSLGVGLGRASAHPAVSSFDSSCLNSLPSCKSIILLRESQWADFPVETHMWDACYTQFSFALVYRVFGVDVIIIMSGRSFALPGPRLWSRIGKAIWHWCSLSWIYLLPIHISQTHWGQADRMGPCNGDDTMTDIMAC